MLRADHAEAVGFPVVGPDTTRFSDDNEGQGVFRIGVIPVAVRDLLERFRPAGAPGAAASAGIPGDRGRQLQDELDPVLALLADEEQECAVIRRSARDRADRIRTQSASRAAATTAAARQQADAARAEAAARQRRRTQERAAEELRDAQRRARSVDVHVAERGPAIVARAVDELRAELLQEPSGPDARQGGPS